MPNFKKSDGFSLGGNPFTMKKGSKEINTEGSFRKEATDKMGGYGSPLFAITGRDPRSAGAAYDDSSVSDMGEDVDAAQSESKAFKTGQEKKKDKTGQEKKKEAAQKSKSALSNPEIEEAKKSVIGDVKEQKIVDADDVEVAEIEEDIEF
jgi:hypothetical protein